MRKTRSSSRLKAGSSRMDGFAIASFVAVLIPIVSFPIVMYVPSVATLPFPGGPRNSGDADIRIFFTLGVFVPILALIFGLIARGRIVGSEEKVRGRALYHAGIVLGLVELAFVVLAFLLMVNAFSHDTL